MKEFYIAPELKLLAFAPVEEMASARSSFDDLLGGNEEQLGGGLGSQTIVDPGDIEILI